MTPPTARYHAEGGVGVITLDNPPMNALHPDVLAALFRHLQHAHNDPSVKAVVLTGSGKNFCAGFDINQFQKGSGGLDGTVNEAICQYIESGPKPTVAAIQGVALGGGCELAIACNARVCAPGSRIGLPELQLGIIPGFGGTQRLPRLVGLKKGCEMMLTSQPVGHKEAVKLGLVDEVVPAEKLLQAAIAAAVSIADGTRSRIQTLYRTDRLEALGEALMVIDFARAQSAKRARHLHHPQLCLDAVLHGVQNGGRAGLQKEAECFAAAAALDTHKALVHIFFAQRSTKRVAGITDSGLKPRPLRKVAVLGGGLMGSGIATALLVSGHEVLLKEVNQEFLQGGLKRVQANLASSVKKGKLTQSGAEALLGRLQGVLDYNAFNTVDMVIEAVIEDIPLKQKIFVDLEKSCRQDCILSTNTSTIDINIVGAKTKAQDRIVGAHFFSPAHIMPLLEIVRTEHTSKQVILDTIELASRIKKTPVVVGNCTGFAVNRVFFPYTMSACMLVDLGMNPYQIDNAIYSVFGMPMGPFRLSDLVGGDVGVHVGKNFHDSFPERVYPSMLLPFMMEAKRLGEKTGKGFYKYDNKRRAKPDPEIEAVVRKSIAAAGLLKQGDKPLKLTDQEIIEFIFFPVVNEGCRVVAEGIVDKPADLDVATVLSMGFPPYRGGLIFWADLVGAPKIVAKLDQLAEQFGPRLAGIFKPCEYLRSCAASGRKLGAGPTNAARL